MGEIVKTNQRENLKFIPIEEVNKYNILSKFTQLFLILITLCAQFFRLK